MKVELSKDMVRSEFAGQVEAISGQNLFACYQCGNCTAGCPVAFAMDVGPHEVIRYTVLGWDQEALQAGASRLCASCLQCSCRCPKGIDVARVMEAIRNINLRNKERLDLLNLSGLPEETWEKIPQIALISAFRKFLS